MTIEKENNSKPPYLMGLLGIIPLVGAFVGIALILYGVLKYKDRRLVVIGAFCILFTVLVYTVPFYWMSHSKFAGEGFAAIAQQELDGLTNQIEFYKIKNGTYPDSLQQILKMDPVANIYDPLLGRRYSEGKIEFKYRKVGSGYTLFSVGLDGISHTADDIYPVLRDTMGFKYGLVK